jgi:transposase
MLYSRAMSEPSDAISEADLPTDPDALRALLLVERAARIAAEARSSAVDAKLAEMKLEIARLRRETYGQSSERHAHLIEQLELELADLEGDVAQDEVAAEVAAAAAAGKTLAPARSRRQPKRGPLPAHLPRERVVIASPTACPCCGGGALSKLGEDVTETLEVIPRRWFVKQTVRERWSCRACETITQPPAPFHVIARGRAGPSLLAMILWSKYAMHLPLTRQADAYAREGAPIDVSTMADWVGACAAALEPLTQLIRTHVFAAERIHADDTPVPVLAKGKTRTGRLWTYVRDDRPFAGSDPPAAIYFYSSDRGGAHPRRHLADWTGLMQADAFSGYTALYTEGRAPGAIVEAACWAHGRRKFFELASLSKAPIALAAVEKIDAIFAIEREINGHTAEDRLAVRRERVAPLVADLHTWMRAERTRVSGKSKTGQALDYMLKRWEAFARFLQDGRLCLSNNAAERAIRGIAVGRRNWTFAGSDRGGERAAAIYTLMETAKLNDVDPHAWLADVLERIAETPVSRLAELLPWNWNPQKLAVAA